ncbi:hypothetical protein E2562_019510 [Oryza meyeriana var. granulata]|uniref:Uncharacterized protein n=1 Tax=Oryza meyeriana var. granulata TaxID=110450 RepID=A0A6G1CGY3_9ORYZ|nr:hypothetical protein E2562_019510 [Oryza meyeriana var. granulata]
MVARGYGETIGELGSWVVGPQRRSTGGDLGWSEAEVEVGQRQHGFLAFTAMGGRAVGRSSTWESKGGEGVNPFLCPMVCRVWRSEGGTAEAAK